MRLTPRETDKLMLHYAGTVAKGRLERGILLSYPEAIAYISMNLLELAREGKSVSQLMQAGKQMLRSEQVMDGVAEMIHEIQLEVTFPDGTKLVTVHDPIPASGALVPGEYLIEEGTIRLNEGRKTVELEVTNTADRPVQTGSHFHFFEVNKCLSFDREKAYGYHLDIPSGTSVRFEPGEEKEVQLTEMGGRQRVFGLNDLTRAQATDDTKAASMETAKLKGFL